MVSGRFGSLFDKNIRIIMQNKFQKLKLILYEDEVVYDSIKRAKDSCLLATDTLMILLQTVSGEIMKILGMACYLAVLKIELIFPCLIIMIPEYVKISLTKKLVKYSNEVLIPVKRREEQKIRKKISILTAKYQIISGISYVMAYAMILVIASYLLFTQELSIDKFSTAIIAADSIRRAFASILANVGIIMQRMEYVDHFFDFLEMEECQGEIELLEPVKEIELKDVGFWYNSNKKILDGISIDIGENDVIAIVGENGAGKTTLAKIVGSLFEPTSGEILYNGMDGTSCNKESLIDSISVMFQHFGKYKCTLKEHVCLNENADDIRVKKCLQMANFNSTYVTNDSLLGTEFGGRDLSGGQWQQIALARTNYKKSSVIILDEPTSAIDSLKEKEMLESFREMCKGKIGILITHRMSMAKLANRIIVLEDGKIIEQGTHKELMDLYGSIVRSEFYESLHS